MQDLTERGRALGTKRLQEAPIFTISIQAGDSESTDEAREPCKKKVVMKSGKMCTTDSMLPKKVTDFMS